MGDRNVCHIVGYAQFEKGKGLSTFPEPSSHTLCGRKMDGLKYVLIWNYRAGKYKKDCAMCSECVKLEAEKRTRKGGNV